MNVGKRPVRRRGYKRGCGEKRDKKLQFLWKALLPQEAWSAKGLGKNCNWSGYSLHTQPSHLPRACPQPGKVVLLITLMAILENISSKAF